jgi:hypothetical protein
MEKTPTTKLLMQMQILVWRSRKLARFACSSPVLPLFLACSANLSAIAKI